MGVGASLFASRLAALLGERADLAELLAIDPASRTGRNFDRRDNLDRRIERLRAKLAAERADLENRPSNTAQTRGDSRNDSDLDSGLPPTAIEAATCGVCGRKIPESKGCRKVRSDASYCGSACRQTAYRRRTAG